MRNEIFQQQNYVLDSRRSCSPAGFICRENLRKTIVGFFLRKHLALHIRVTPQGGSEKSMSNLRLAGERKLFSREEN